MSIGKGKKPKTEHLEQVEFVAWFEKNHPDVKIYSVPNGGMRAPTTAAKLKAEGCKAGVPDLCIPEWFVYIEMKSKRTGRVTTWQKHWLEYLRRCGYAVSVCRGAERARTFIEAVKLEIEATEAARHMLARRNQLIEMRMK